MLNEVEEPYEFLEYVWEAFWRLNDGRGIVPVMDGGCIPAPITFEAIYYYARVYGYDEQEEFEEFERYVRALDNVYVDYKIRGRAK